MPVWAWIVAGAVLFVPALFLSPFVAAAALAILITGAVGLTRGTRTWLRFPTRRAAGTVTAVAAAGVLLFGGVAAAGVGQANQSDPPAAVRFADSGATPQRDDIEKPSPTPTPVTTLKDEIVKEAVPYVGSTVEDPAMPQGQTAVTTVGQPGEKTLTYRVTLVDGVETHRELVSEVVTVEPVTEVTSVGTYVAPAPAPAAPAGCNSNYAGACVPMASDVDCAWGSGDGPEYLVGVAQVVGEDVYDLDRNGDGVACEQ